MQAKILDWAMKRMGLADNPAKVNNTAVVLLDESLLFPVLYSMPEYVPGINITLQFPFYLTSFYSFLNKWLYVLSQFLRNGQVYYKDFQLLISSEVMQKFFPDFVRDFNQKYHSYPDLQITLDYLKGLDQYDVLFGLGKMQARELVEMVLSLVHRIYKDADDFEREYIFHIHSHLQSLKKQINELKIDFSAEIMVSLLRQMFYSIRVPFEGQKINALQVITIMETRNLDFDNVIILSANEGIYPPIKRGQSFFPEFVRAAYQLPILRYQDSLFSYFFYRLLQRAKKVMIVYNSVLDKGVEGKSRYILQLEKETGLIKENHVFTDVLTLPKEIVEGEVENLPETVRSISVSAINTYLTCPRKYYYHYVIGLQAPEQDNDLEMTDAEFGTVVHYTLETLYAELQERTGNNITEHDLKKAKQEVDDFLIRAWQEFNLEHFYNKGFFKILYGAMKEYVNNVLDFDLKYAPLSVISLEKRKGKYETNFDIGEGRQIKLYGIIDRIDRSGEFVRLIDYKTGKKELIVSNFDKLFSQEHNKEVFQLLFYKLLVKDNFKGQKVIPVLYSLPLLRSRGYTGFIKLAGIVYSPDLTHVLDDMVIPEYEERLRVLLRKILFEDRTFPKTGKSDTCNYCPYLELCN